MKRWVNTLLVALLSGSLWAVERSDLTEHWPAAERDSGTVAASLAGNLTAGSYAPVFSPLTGQRPRLSVALLDGSSWRAESGPASTFSWSLEAWQLNTASLAHIQCSRATQTLETYLVEDCRFVDRPPPADAANLVQVRGQWMAAPYLSIGLGAFSGDLQTDPQTTIQLFDGGLIGSPLPLRDEVDGLDVNLSFGIQAGRVGDLLVDLQLARYRRQARSFTHWSGLGENPLMLEREYQSAGQLALGWRKGDFSGDVMGTYRELPYWFGGHQGQSLSSFDIEFSWRAPGNASISVGVSNVLDRAPSGDSGGAENGLDDPMDGIYGRIPYVRYKHDL